MSFAAEEKVWYKRNKEAELERSSSLEAVKSKPESLCAFPFLAGY